MRATAGVASVDVQTIFVAGKPCCYGIFDRS